MNKHWPYKKSKYGKKKHGKRDTPNLGLEPVLFYRKEEKNVEKFWDMLKTSVIVQSLITMAFAGTCCYLWATQLQQKLGG
jgi:hypothetical protein